MKELLEIFGDIKRLSEDEIAVIEWGT